MGDTVKLGSSERYIDRADKLIKLQRYEEGLKDLKKAELLLGSRNNSLELPIKAKLADCLIAMGKYEEAIYEVNHILIREPANILAHLKHAEILYLLQNFEEAVKKYDQILNINDKIPEAYAGRADIHLNMGLFEKAEMDFIKGCELDDQNESKKKKKKKRKVIIKCDNKCNTNNFFFFFFF